MSIPAEHMERIQGAEESKVEEAKPEAAKTTVTIDAEELESLRQANKELGVRVDKSAALVLKMLETQAAAAPAAAGREVKEPDWENMSTKDIVQLVVGEIRKGDESLRKDLTERVDKLRVEMAVTDAAEKYDDFLEYGDDIIAIAKEKAGALTPEEAYFEAKRRKGEVVIQPRKKSVPAGVIPGSRESKLEPAPKDSREAASKAYKAIFK